MSKRADAVLIAAVTGAVVLGIALLRELPAADVERGVGLRRATERRAPDEPDPTPLEGADTAPDADAVGAAAQRAPAVEGPDAGAAAAEAGAVEPWILAVYGPGSFADRLRAVMALEGSQQERALIELAEAIRDEEGSADREILGLLEAGADPALLEGAARFLDVGGGLARMDRALVARAISLLTKADTPAERRVAALLALQYRGRGVLTANDAALAAAIQRDGDPLLLRKIAWHYRQVTDTAPPTELARVVAHIADGDVRPDTRAAALAARLWIGAGSDQGLARLQECLAIGDAGTRRGVVQAIAESELPSLDMTFRFDLLDSDFEAARGGRAVARSVTESVGPSPVLTDLVVRLYQDGADAGVRSRFLRAMMSNLGAGNGTSADQSAFLQRLIAVETDAAWRGKLEATLEASRANRWMQSHFVEALFGGD